MTKVASDAVERDAAAFVRHVRASARAWERGNNSGDPRELERGQKLSEKRSEQAEELAARYGCSCSWPGLYPVLERRQGDSTLGEYSTSDAARVARFFAEGRS